MNGSNYFSASPSVTYPSAQQARSVHQTITECTIGCLHVIKCAEFRGSVSMQNVTITNLSADNASFGSLSADNATISNVSVTNIYNEALSNMSYLHWETIQQLQLSGSPLVPHVAMYSTMSQSISIDNHPSRVMFNTVAISNPSFVQVSGTRLYSQIDGTLNVDFTYQFYNQGGGGSVDTATVWIARNGVNVPHSGNSLHVPTNGRDVSYSGGLYVPVSVGDYIELMWATGNHQAIYAHYIPATSTYPDTPSVKCEIHLLKNL